MEEKSLNIYNQVLEYFKELETVAVPNAQTDLAALEAFCRGDENVFLGDRLSSLIFKNRTLLKAAKNHEKKRKRDFKDDGSDNDDGGDDGGDDDDEKYEEIDRSILKYQIKPKFVWSNTEVDNLMVRAKQHMSYLRKIRSVPWTKLKIEERAKIKDYMTRTRAWTDRVCSGQDRLAYECEAVKLICTIAEKAREARDYMEDMHTVERVVSFNDTSPSEPEATVLHSAPTASSKAAPPNIGDTLGVITSPVHRELCECVERLQKLSTATLNIFGSVRYSGDVVQNMNVEQPLPKAPLEQSHEDPWITSGLMCAACGVMRVIDTNEAKATCPSCTISVDYQQAHLGCTFQDQQNLIQTRGKNYVPKNYAMVWLRKVQGKLAIDIPEEIFNVIFSYCFSKKIKTVNFRIVRTILKKNGYTNYYNAVPFITYRFNEVPLALFSQQEENILSQMFDEALAAFKVCPPSVKKGRTSFISYSYFFHKCVEMHGWNQYKKSFPLLEGYKNLKQHDVIWRWICDNRQGPGEPWNFIATV
jgi:hypothetical protein